MMEQVLNLTRKQKAAFPFRALALCAATAAIVALMGLAMPVYQAQQQMNAFAAQLVQTAGEAGQIGGETEAAADAFSQQTGLAPQVVWSQTGDISTGETVSVQVTGTLYFALPGNLGSVPVRVVSMAQGSWSLDTPYPVN